MGSIHDMDICWIFAICSVAIVDIWLWLMMIYIVTMLGFQPKSPTMKVLHDAARLLVRAASCDVATSSTVLLAGLLLTGASRAWLLGPLLSIKPNIFWDFFVHS